MAAYASVPEMLAARVAESGDALAFQHRVDGVWTDMSWNEAAARVRAIASGLHGLGINKGDRVAILSGTRVEWVLADLGILCAGGAVSTIYPSNTPEECAYILTDCGARWCIAENPEQLAKLHAVWEQCKDLEGVILIDGDHADPRIITLARLEETGASWDRNHEGEYDARAAAVGPEDLATLIYTSGTTGPPKGVMLVHDNWCATAESVDETARDFMEPGDKQYLFLPLSHSFGKVLEFIAIRSGVPTAIDGSIDTLVDGLKEVQPTFMAAVPRVFEKVYNKIVNQAKAGGERRYGIFKWAVGVGQQASRRRMAGEPLGVGLAAKAWIADKLVFSKLRAAFGGKLRCFFSGGAPLSQEIAEFFYAADILILEGYGMTETSAASFGNRMAEFRFGTVGKPNPGVDVRIADDGEILVKGRGIMRGYYNLPDKTAEALEADGWLHTGDIGELDSDGFLKITGRKKELIITAGGKNIAPAHAEGLIKARSAYVSQIVMHGDRRNFCVALVTIDEEATTKWAADNGVAFTDYADLAGKPEVHALVWRDVEAVNTDLASYETIKKIALLPADLAVETGELTPTLKVKRRVVEERYAGLLDGFYEGSLTSM